MNKLTEWYKNVSLKKKVFGFIGLLIVSGFFSEPIKTVLILVDIFLFFSIGYILIKRLLLKVVPKRKGLLVYEAKAKELVLDGSLSDEDLKILEDIKTEYKLTDQDVVKYNIEALRGFASKTFSDSRVTEEERQQIVQIHKKFNLPADAVVYSQKDFNKYYILDQIDRGNIPTTENHDLNINMGIGEKLYFADKAFFVKNRSVTERISYGGFSGSVKIMKGVRYRVGSLKVNAQKKQVLSSEDVGFVYMTTDNIGYLGVHKNFSLPYDKIVSLDIKNGYLFIYKKGKETPFIISMNDYEVLLAIVSFKLNQ
jgi:hypothetical protein